MKKIFIFTFIFLAAVSLYARAIQEDIDLAEEKTLESYAIGILMGRNLKADSIELDYDSFLQGFIASMENAETQISINEAMEIATAAFDKAQEKAAEEQRLIQEEFLTNNSVKPGVHVTPSGLQFEIITEGEGEKPAPNSVTKVYYTGTLIDGTEFDNSGAEFAYIPLEMVIPGWSEALQLMSVGSKYRFYMPANLAYGKEGYRGLIPPYATLIFDVELLEFMDSESFFKEHSMGL